MRGIENALLGGCPRGGATNGSLEFVASVLTELEFSVHLVNAGIGKGRKMPPFQAAGSRVSVVPDGNAEANPMALGELGHLQHQLFNVFLLLIGLFLTLLIHLGPYAVE